MEQLHDQLPTEKYYSAHICENGHEQRNNDNKFCPDCGGKTFDQCQYCHDIIKHGYNDGEPIFANPYDPEELSGYEHFQIPFEDFKMPNYCYNCGEPYRWTEKFLNEYKLILELQTEELDEVLRANVYKATEEAIKQKFSKNSTIILGLRLKKLDPQVKSTMIELLKSVATSEIINLLRQ